MDQPSQKKNLKTGLREKRRGPVRKSNRRLTSRQKKKKGKPSTRVGRGGRIEPTKGQRVALGNAASPSSKKKAVAVRGSGKRGKKRFLPRATTLHGVGAADGETVV